jgi:Smg protein
MFDVLVFVYENYWRGDDCPEPQQLGRKLSAVGFGNAEITAALTWLEGLDLATHGSPGTHDAAPDAVDADQHPTEIEDFFANPLEPAQEPAPWTSTGTRVYSVQEQTHLGLECLGFLKFLENAGELPPHLREVVLDRAMATRDSPLQLDQLKIIVLMVYWSLDLEPDALVLHELCDDASGRIAH